MSMTLPIVDRDTKYSDAFRGLLVREAIQVIRLPLRAPDLKANASYCLLF